MEPEKYREMFLQLEAEVRKVIVGHADVIRKVLVAFFAGGHVLLEGVPGLGKTLLIKSLSRALGLSFKRVQFTPDLMPSDIIGTQVLAESDGRREFQFKKGPIFAQVILADEINRATPKTQSAVLEAMEEKQVTVFGESYPLEAPFMVLATQNPIELEGTYPLPEAQLDRFFFKLLVSPPSPRDLGEILQRTTGAGLYEAGRVFAHDGAAAIVQMQQLLRQVMIAPPLEDYVVRLVHATQPAAGKGNTIAAVHEYLRFGSSPRGAQAIILGAKGNALVEGRVHVSYEDIETVIYPALRHRLILNFQAEAENINADQILAALVKKVPRD
ncbi:MAG: AAA family ATPase [Deltaproteobacteria bacterium]|nr:AAA family ATPase [Deltaproteobacteria bacterium]MBI2539227.1 AAA family ATPase [Deltaproteobacteria bacterium]MBI3061361.1 AAA family ATPase [Deltaproteobacteria bacterium]